MSTPANLRGWGQGWPTNRIADQVWVRARISGAKWQVHREIAPIIQWIVDEVERRGYLFDWGPDDVDDDWGFNNRPIRGTRKPSNHSWGLSIDFDAQEYPQHSSRRAPQWIYDLFYAYGFEIGADWGKGSVDPMHVEFRGSITEARFIVAMLAAAHIASQPPALPPSIVPPITPPPYPSEEDDMRIYRCAAPTHEDFGQVWLAFSDGTRQPVAGGAAYPLTQDIVANDWQGRQIEVTDPDRWNVMKWTFRDRTLVPA